MQQPIWSKIIVLAVIGWTGVARGAGDSLSWQQGNGFRSATLAVPSNGKAGFTLMPPSQTGVAFTNLLSDEKAALNQIRLNGSGVAAGDIDGDGWVDLYFCGLEGPNRLYRNLGHWKFQELTNSPEIACLGQFSTGAVFADVDGDGDLDLLVNGLGVGTRLFLNDGHGKFTEAKDSGLIRKFGSTSMALADIDGDGTLDLYVANYRTNTIRSTGLEFLVVNGKRMLKPEDRDQIYFTSDGFLRERGDPDQIYLNDGHGHFRALSWTDGRFRDEAGRPLTETPRDWGFSVVFRDLNGDGAPDIYVCNDFWSPDRIWLNDGKGNFQALPREALPVTSSFSMGIDFADINRDGWDDFLVLDMLSPNHQRHMRQVSLLGLQPWPIGFQTDRPQVEHNTLFLNRGDGTYAEIAQFSGVDATEWSWCPVFLDVDLDGYEDLLISTGYGFDTQDSDGESRIRSMAPWPREKVPFKVLLYPRLPLPKVAFRNRHDATFENASAQWGFNQVGISQGMALADLDNDGDLDVIVNNMNGPAGLYRNNGSAPRIGVRLKGAPPNTRGIGAKIIVRGGPVEQSQQMICGGRYLSGDDPMRVFAAGSITNVMRIEVTWRSGHQSVVEGARANRIYEVEETGRLETKDQRPTTKDQAPRSPLFEDVSDLVKHVHSEEPYDDFARQPLLPNKLSQLGPGVAWHDLNQDGWEDLIIGGGKGGRMAIFRNQNGNAFERIETIQLQRDQTTVLGCDHAGQAVILAGSSHYEDAAAASPAAFEFDPSGRLLPNPLPSQASSTGPMALADLDGDGELDLFVGGRVLPGRYPEAASSMIFLRRNGKWELDRDNSERLAGIGLVSGALFSDLNGDGWPDLILACEWGPIRVFQNDHGRLREITREIGLDQCLGWWNGIAAGDFDGDGRLDIVAANWGKNTKYQRYRPEPLYLYFGDPEGDGTVKIVEAHFDRELKKIVPERPMDALAQNFPQVVQMFASNAAYGTAGISEILGDALPKLLELKANCLESMVFLNRGDHFEPRILPDEAQWSPAFGVSVADFDGDGCEDIFLAQNFFATQPETSPYASGRGLLLRGDGNGNFRPMPGQESGVRVYGEQRGCAVCDYDRDGRIDLVVAQNNGPTKLYHNVRARPGVRVRLEGGPGNPWGIGATVRLKFGDHFGPAREIHAGSGYWSQDSAVQVLAAGEAPAEIWVRWPGGKITSVKAPAQFREVKIRSDGTAQVTAR